MNGEVHDVIFFCFSFEGCCCRESRFEGAIQSSFQNDLSPYEDRMKRCINYSFDLNF